MTNSPNSNKCHVNKSHHIKESEHSYPVSKAEASQDLFFSSPKYIFLFLFWKTLSGQHGAVNTNWYFIIFTFYFPSKNDCRFQEVDVVRVY